MIEPGTLIIGVSEEGILHQLQLCRGPGGTGLWLGSWLPQHPTLSLVSLQSLIACMPAFYTSYIYQFSIFPLDMSSLLSGAESCAPPETGMK